VVRFCEKIFDLYIKHIRVTKERAVLIYSIIKGEDMNVGVLITNNINKILKSTNERKTLKDLGALCDIQSTHACVEHLVQFLVI